MSTDDEISPSAEVGAKPRLINLKVTDDQYEAIKAAAARSYKGNVSRMLRERIGFDEYTDFVVGRAKDEDSYELLDRLEEEANELRDAMLKHPNEPTEIVHEIGDCLFFLAMLAHKFGITLGEVAIMNRIKLLDRDIVGKEEEA